MALRGRSVIWTYFTKTFNREEKTAECNLCKNVFSYKSTTSNLKHHLQKKHVATYEELRDQVIHRTNFTNKSNSSFEKFDNSDWQENDGQETVYIVQDYMEVDVNPAHIDQGCHMSQSAPSPSIINNANNVNSVNNVQPAFDNSTPKGMQLRRKRSVPIGSIDQKPNMKKQQSMDRDLLDLFILDFQPFSLVEDRGFKKFIGKWLPEYKLPSKKAISTTMIPALYNKCLNRSREIIKNEVESICITCDTWTAKDSRYFMAVTGHYVSRDFNFRSVLLACNQLAGKHSAGNIAAEMSNIIDDWGLNGKVNFAVSDNSDEMVSAFENELRWTQYGCYARKLNSIVQNSLEDEHVKGVLEKVKSIVNHFKMSPVANEKFLKYQVSNGIMVPMSLVQDVATRWNSTFHMLERFVKLEESVRVTIAILDHKFAEVTVEEWSFLKNLLQILRPFEEMTKKMSGEKYCTGSSVLLITRTLLLACERLDQLDLTSPARRVLQDLQKGLEEHFGGVEYCSHFSLCTLMDPRYKDKTFKNANALDKAKSNLKREVASIIEEGTISAHPQMSSSIKPDQQEYNNEGVNVLDILNELVSDKTPKVGTPFSRASKEVEDYLSDDLFPTLDAKKETSNPLDWWRVNRGKYPNLASLVCSKCNILATSVPCERIFSDSGNLITDKSTSLTSEKDKMIMFLNNNYDLYQS